MFIHKLPYIIALLTVFLTACNNSPANRLATSSSPALETVFPDQIMGWRPSEEVHLYNRDNLFDLVDGQAEGFFVYGFEQVAVQVYTDSNQKEVHLEVWQSGTPADAYGLFTFGRYGNPVNVGNGGYSEPGQHLSFWQDRYNVHVSSYEKIDDKILWSFTQSVSNIIPKGGKPPSLINHFLINGFKESDLVFFHEELSIQNVIWLGGEKILGLSHDTNGVMASYKLSGQPVSLLLIEYPTAGQAAAGAEALQTGQEIDLVTTRAQDNLLLAVFGKADKVSVEDLVTKILPTN